MKLVDKISWLMGRVQRSLFPHLNQCLSTPLTEQEERLVSILELVQVEGYTPKNISNIQYPGRKPLDRQALARAFVAKAYYRLATTSDLRRTLLAVWYTTPWWSNICYRSLSATYVGIQPPLSDEKNLRKRSKNRKRSRKEGVPPRVNSVNLPLKSDLIGKLLRALRNRSAKRRFWCQQRHGKGACKGISALDVWGFDSVFRPTSATI